LRSEQRVQWNEHDQEQGNLSEDSPTISLRDFRFDSRSAIAELEAARKLKRRTWRSASTIGLAHLKVRAAYSAPRNLCVSVAR